MSGIRMTLQTQLVLKEMLLNPTQAHYGLTLGQAVGLQSGTIHPILARLERAGIITSFWEKPEEHEAAVPPRPRRRYYQFTNDGAEHARTELAEAYERQHKPSGRTAGRPVTDS
ncbi:PadR family transcriptional regulator [Streptomyces sp. NPDC002499]